MPQVLADATRALQRMDRSDQLQMSDEIHQNQPHLKASVLALHRYMGANLRQIEPLVYILMLTWQAMKTSGHEWPLISEQLLGDCLQRLTAKLAFVEGMPVALQQQAIQEQVDSHPEPYLLAIVYEELRKQGWLQMKTETEKYLVLTALNLVECVATAKPRDRTPRAG